MTKMKNTRCKVKNSNSNKIMMNILYSKGKSIETLTQHWKILKKKR